MDAEILAKENESLKKRVEELKGIALTQLKKGDELQSRLAEAKGCLEKIKNTNEIHGYKYSQDVAKAWLEKNSVYNGLNKEKK